MPGWNQPTVVGLSPVSPSVGYPPGGGAFPGFVRAPQAPVSRGLEQIALAKVQAKLAKEAAEIEAKRAETKAKTALHERMMMKGWEKGEDWLGEGPEPIAEDMGYRKGPYGGQWKPPKPEIISAGTQQLLRTGPTTYTILKPNTHVTTQVDEKGNVTLLGIDKDSGTETFKKTYKGMGKPGRIGTQISIGEKVQQAVDTATGKKTKVPGSLYNAALQSMEKGMSLKEKMELNRDPALRHKRIVEEMGKQANIISTYPGAVLGPDPRPGNEGRWVWARQDENGRWLLVLDEFGLR